MLADDCGGSIWAVAAENVSGGAGGGMLHTGCECWDGASVSLTQFWNASVQCPPAPPARPPPLSSSNKWSFCLSVFLLRGPASLGEGRALTPGDSPATAPDHTPSLVASYLTLLLSSLLSGFLYRCFFLSLLFYSITCLRSSTQDLCSKVMFWLNFWNSVPPSLSATQLLIDNFWPPKLKYFTLFDVCFHFCLQMVLKIDFIFWSNEKNSVLHTSKQKSKKTKKLNWKKIQTWPILIWTECNSETVQQHACLDPVCLFDLF